MEIYFDNHYKGEVGKDELWGSARHRIMIIPDNPDGWETRSRRRDK